MSEANLLMWGADICLSDVMIECGCRCRHFFVDIGDGGAAVVVVYADDDDDDGDDDDEKRTRSADYCSV